IDTPVAVTSGRDSHRGVTGHEDSQPTTGGPSNREALGRPQRLGDPLGRLAHANQLEAGDADRVIVGIDVGDQASTPADGGDPRPDRDGGGEVGLGHATRPRVSASSSATTARWSTRITVTLS